MLRSFVSWILMMLIKHAELHLIKQGNKSVSVYLEPKKHLIWSACLGYHPQQGEAT